MVLLPRTIIGAVLLALASTAASAQGGASAPPAEASKGGALAVCQPDVAKLCPDAKGATRGACLRQNTDKLSPACAAAFADVTAKAKAMREACTEDVKIYCSSARKSKGARAVVKCLEANKTKLTPTCSAAIDARYGD